MSMKWPPVSAPLTPLLLSLLSPRLPADGGCKLIRRKDGRVERQYRLNIGPLPVAYRTEPEGQFLYVLDEALSTFDNAYTRKGLLVPPCIMQIGADTTQLLMGFDESQNPRIHQGITGITSDEISYITRNKIVSQEFEAEVIALLAEVLKVERSAVSVLKGFTPRTRMVVVEGGEALKAQAIYSALMDHLQQKVEKALKGKNMTLDDV
jgi:uncharacterized protein